MGKASTISSYAPPNLHLPLYISCYCIRAMMANEFNLGTTLANPNVDFHCINDVSNPLGFVLGLIQQLDTTDIKHDAWARCNNMEISWILNSIAKEIRASLTHMNTVEQM